MSATPFNYKQSPAPLLFANALERNIRSPHELRNLIGDMVEDFATAHFPPSRRIKINGNVKINPDVHYDSNRYFECKSCGRNGSVIIYEGRLAKDQQFVEQGNTLHYMIWSHSLDTRDIKTTDQLKSCLINSIKAITVVPLSLLVGLTNNRPVRCLNSGYTNRGNRLGYGNGSKGYGMGWCLPLKLIQAECEQSFTWFKGRSVPLLVKGNIFKESR